MRSVEDLDVKGKTVFLRVDFNVPINEQGEIRNDTRIKASLPTITYLLGRGAKLVLASHLGRPKGKPDPKMSLKPVAARLAELIPNEVTQAPDVVGPEVDALKKALEEGEALLLENVRFTQAKRTTTTPSPGSWPRASTSSSTTPSAPATGPTPRSSASPNSSRSKPPDTS